MKKLVIASAAFIFLLFSAFRGFSTSEEKQIVSIREEPFAKSRYALSKKYEKQLENLCDPHSEKILSDLVALDLIAYGQYEDYIQVALKQEDEDQLKWGEFKELQSLYLEVIKSFPNEDIYSFMQQALVAIEKGDREIASNPELLQKIYAFSDYYNLLSLDGGLYAFEKCQKNVIQHTQEHEWMLCFLIHLLYQSSQKDAHIIYPLIGYTNSKHLAAMKTKQALIAMKQIPAQQAYKQLLEEQADLLHLNYSHSYQKLITKLSVIFQVYDRKEIFYLTEGLVELDPKDVGLLIEIFEDDLYLSKLHNFTTFAQNLSHHYQLDLLKENRIKKAVSITMKVLCRCYKEQQSKNLMDITLEFAPIIERVQKDPFSIKADTLTIGEEGKILL